jgi:exodeoxyribonuclease VII small subunit
MAGSKYQRTGNGAGVSRIVGGREASFIVVETYVDRYRPIALFYASLRITMTKATSSPPQNFESALAELENIVAQMESGKLPLEETLSAYKRGAELLQYCQNALADAQQQVLVLENGVLNKFQSGDA